MLWEYMTGYRLDLIYRRDGLMSKEIFLDTLKHSFPHIVQIIWRPENETVLHQNRNPKVNHFPY